MKTFITRACFWVIFAYLGVMTWALLVVALSPRFVIFYGVVGFVVFCQVRFVDAWLVRRSAKGGA